jgi:hypothetical protein
VKAATVAWERKVSEGEEPSVVSKQASQAKQEKLEITL